MEPVSVSKQRDVGARRPGCAVTSDHRSREAGDKQLLSAPGTSLSPAGEDHRPWGGLFRQQNPAFGDLQHPSRLEVRADATGAHLLD